MVLLLLGAVGLALIIVGVGTAAGWRMVVPGFLALVVSLPGIHWMRAGELEAASQAVGRGRGISLRRDQRDPRDEARPRLRR